MSLKSVPFPQAPLLSSVPIFLGDNKSAVVCNPVFPSLPGLVPAKFDLPDYRAIRNHMFWTITEKGVSNIFRGGL